MTHVLVLPGDGIQRLSRSRLRFLAAAHKLA